MMEYDIQMTIFGMIIPYKSDQYLYLYLNLCLLKMTNQYRRLQQSLNDQERYIIFDVDRIDYLKSIIDKRYSLNQLPQLIADAASQEIQRKYHGYIGLRRIISVQKSPIDVFIQYKLIPFLLEHLNDNPQIHLETLRIFTFIASGNDKQSFHLTDKPVFQFIVSSLLSNVDKIGLEAIWTIANLLGDSNDNRIICMNAGIVQILLERLDLQLKADNKEKYSSIVWALSNICRGKPLQQYNKISKIVLKMIQCLNEVTMVSAEMMQEVIWSIYNYKTVPEVMQLLSNAQSIQKLLLFAQEKILNTIYPSLKLVLQLFKSNKEMQNFFKEWYVLDVISSLLLQKRSIRRFSFQILMNFFKQKWTHEAIITHSQLLNNLLSHSIDSDMINDTCEMLSVLLQSKDVQALVQSYTSNKVIKYLLTEVTMCEYQVGICLDTLYKIIKFGYSIQPNPFLIQLQNILMMQKSQKTYDTFDELQSSITQQANLNSLLKITCILGSTHT